MPLTRPHAISDEVDPIFHICDTATVFRRIPFSELEAIVNEPLPDEVCCLDYDNEKPKLRLSDDQVWQHIIQLTNTTNATDFQRLEKDLQHETLRELRLQGASVRQLERLTGISRGIIQYIKLQTKLGLSPILTGTRPLSSGHKNSNPIDTGTIWLLVYHHREVTKLALLT